MSDPVPPTGTAATPPSGYRSVLRPDLFAGQLHWVTGGGSGIGRCVAHELASLGATVVVSGRTQGRLDAVAAEIAQDGGRCHAIAFDIRDEEAVKDSVARVIATHGPVAGLVNNAGGQFPSPLEAIGKKGFDAVVANNLTGGFLMMRELYTQCMHEHGGAIVNMTADFRNGMPGMGHSGAARAGMSNLTMSAAYEWAPAGVRVNAVAPSIAIHAFLRKSASEELLAQLESREAFGRGAEPWEIANVMIFLASDYSSYMTGEVVSVSSQHA